MELQIEGVSKTYGNGVQALRQVTLSIPTGMFGLLGPNGSGKSTLMRSIATLQSVDEGAITLGPLNVLEDKQAVRRLLGYLPQDFGVYPNVSAESLLTHIAVLKELSQKDERREAVEAVLKLTNLWQVRKQKLGSYSGGMKRRFGVAQALLGNPKLIIVDEPTAGLDPEERHRFLNLLSAIGENIVVILSTHIVEDVQEVCGRMAIISKGQVLTCGAPQEQIDLLAGQTWKKTIVRSELEAHRVSHDVISTRLVSGKVMIHVLSKDPPGAGFIEADPDLEDVYFSTLGKQAGGNNVQ